MRRAQREGNICASRSKQDSDTLTRPMTPILTQMGHLHHFQRWKVIDLIWVPPRLQKSQRKPSASNGGMNLARREATRSAIDSPMPVHGLDLANTSTCWAIEIECRNERSTGSGLIRPPNKRRRSLVMLARADSSLTGRSSVEKRLIGKPANPSHGLSFLLN